MFDKYIDKIKEFLLFLLGIVNNAKVIVYILFFIVYFLFYFAITLPQITSNNNQFFQPIMNLGKSVWFIVILSAINISYFIVLVAIFIYYFKNFKDLNSKKNFLLVIPTVCVSAIIIFINMICYSNNLLFISQSAIVRKVFIIVSSIFYFIFFSLFVYSLNGGHSIEFYISLIILLLFFTETIIIAITNIQQVYNQLANNNFSLLSVNCFNSFGNFNIFNFNREFFDDSNNSQNTPNNQLISIAQQYGDNYLKTNGNIPISFLNSNSNEYQDLILSDFYYPGSYYSYLVDSPLNGTPSLDAIQTALSIFKSRIIHLDLYSSTSSQYDSTAIPVVRCENMANNAQALNIDDVFRTINKWAWITDDPNGSTYPLFLYLNINFDTDNESICISLYNSLLKNFSKYLIDRKYGYSGKSNMLPVSKATMSEAIGKVIICTNIFPTKSVLDELINASANNLNTNFNITLYKENYVHYDQVGISQDTDKTTLINSCISNLHFYYTEPNASYQNNNQDKAGMYNPSFQDCAQYGIQATLMYVFLPDTNLNNWVSFFKNRNNSYPVLKDQSLRLVNIAQPVINPQNPVIGLQTPQQYCVVPGLISTQKSNLSASQTNSSCQ